MNIPFHKLLVCLHQHKIDFADIYIRGRHNTGHCIWHLLHTAYGYISIICTYIFYTINLKVMHITVSGQYYFLNHPKHKLQQCLYSAIAISMYNNIVFLQGVLHMDAPLLLTFQPLFGQQFPVSLTACSQQIWTYRHRCASTLYNGPELVLPTQFG